MPASRAEPPRPAGRPSDTVSRRVGRVSAGVFVVLLAVGAAAILALVSSADTVTRLTNGYGPAGDANSAALTYMLDAETGIRGFALTGRPTALQPYRDAVRKIVPALERVASSLAAIDDHDLDRDIAAELTQANAWIDRVGRVSVSGVLAARRTSQLVVAKALFDNFRSTNARVTDSLDHTRSALRDDTDRQRTLVLPIVILGAVLVVVLASLVALRTARGVSRPLTAVWDVVRRLEAGDLSARADESLGPAEVREVSAAVNSLAIERRRAVATQRADDELRRATRVLTSAIRIGQDSDSIGQTLVAGLGRVFDVDRVWLYTFDDPRVPFLGERWARGGPPERIVAEDPEHDRGALRGLAGRLWHADSVIGIADHARLPDTADPHLSVAPQAASARASVVAAIGEGNSAFGIVWLAVDTRPRIWTATELGLLQHVAAELAQNLVQNHVLVKQREAMRSLREADDAKSTLVSTVSHELRTPLTSIVGYLELLDAYADDIPEEVQGMLRVVRRNTERLRALIDDLLTQSQIEAGRRLVALEPIDLAVVVAGVIETMRPLVDNAQLRLAYQPAAAAQLTVLGDARQLGQALSNLAANAVKFTPAGGTVSVTLARDGEGEDAAALLEVSDSGIGIPADEVPQLFDRFFRASNARAAVIPGTGLGLGIVAEIVHQHHGTVTVHSELGKGTSFVIRLPLMEDAACGAPPVPGPTGSVAGG